jgi:quinol monooxygenase YgiN
MKQTALFCLFLGLVFSISIVPGYAQDVEDPYVIIVELSFDEQNLDTAVDLLLEVQALSLENEEGCLIYDVLLSEDNANTIFLYESYESESAYRIHENSTHFKSIVKNKLTPLIKKSRATKVIPLNLQDELVDEEL